MVLWEFFIIIMCCRPFKGQFLKSMEAQASISSLERTSSSAGAGSNAERGLSGFTAIKSFEQNVSNWNCDLQ